MTWTLSGRVFSCVTCRSARTTCGTPPAAGYWFPSSRASGSEHHHRPRLSYCVQVIKYEPFGTKVVHLGQWRIGEKRGWSFTVLRSSYAARKPIFTVKLQHGIQLMTYIRIVCCFGLFSGVFVYKAHLMRWFTFALNRVAELTRANEIIPRWSVFALNVLALLRRA